MSSVNKQSSGQLSSVASTAAEQRAPISLGERGIRLQTLDEMWRLALFVHKSGLAPKGFQTPEAIIVAWQYGAELGLSLMQSLHGISVINGVPRLNIDAALAVCRASGLFDDAAFVERISETKATCTVRRLPNGKRITRTFTMEDARRAGLIKTDSAWQKYPLRMLQLRARGWALRDAFSDILRGCVLEESPSVAETATTSHRVEIPDVDYIPPKVDRLASHLAKVRAIPDVDADSNSSSEATVQQSIIAADAALDGSDLIESDNGNVSVECDE